jgi:hypothetical protein
MAAFYVGQRVRIVRVKSYPEVLGREAVITGFVSDAWDGEREYAGWQLDFKVQKIKSVAPALYVARPSDIEPILYDGNQLVSWSECLWQPEGQAA